MLFLIFIAGIPLYGYSKKIKIYETFIEGAREGFDIAVRIIPYLLAMMVAIGMFRAAGGFDSLVKGLGPLLNRVHFPPELLPLAIIRPFSGSGANGVFADIAHTFGGNSFLAHAGATLLGSTETTFYVIAVYFGAVNIVRTRYAISIGLLCDAVAILLAIFIAHCFF